jgi:hypothetical protein
MKVLKLLLVHVSVLAFAASVPAAELDLSGLDADEEAALRLNVWLDDIGYKAEVAPSRDAVIITDDGNYTVAPIVSSKGVDRLVIYRFYKGKPSNAKSQELHDIVREINNRFNVCCAFVDEDGDLQLRYTTLFDDKMTPKLFRNSMEHVKSCTKMIIKEYRERFRPFYD